MTLHLNRRAADLAYQVANYPGDHLLTTEELAAWLAVSTMSVKRWNADGIGPKTVRAGQRALRYRKDDVLAWLESRVEKAGA